MSFCVKEYATDTSVTEIQTLDSPKYLDFSKDILFVKFLTNISAECRLRQWLPTPIAAKAIARFPILQLMMVR